MSRLWHAHPVLVAGAFIGFLWSANLDQGVSIVAVMLPLLATSAAAVALTAVGAVTYRGLARGALAATATVIAVLGYEHVRRLVSIAPDDAFLVGWTVVWIGVLVLVGRVRSVMRIGRPVTVVATVVIGLNLVPIAMHGLARGQAADAASEQTLTEGSDAVAPEDRPDIYYLIFDRYPSAETLEEVFGFDNTPFLESLETRGFFVAGESFANYPKTATSIVSSLDMDYLDGDRLASSAAGPADWTPVYDLLEGSLAAPRFLTSLGYTYVSLPSWFEQTGSGSDVDARLSLGGASQFASVLFGTTMLSAVQDELGWTSPVDFRLRAREQSLFQLDRLVTLDEIPSPKLVFAHVLLPHDPFVFDRDGSFVTAELEASRSHRDSFVRQLEYANSRILGVIDELQSANPDRPPVILLQADEGPFPDRYVKQTVGFDWTQATIDEVREKFLILNAYAFPGVTSPDLHEGITPVNSFRALLRAYFDVDIPILEDRAFIFTAERRLYDLFEITALLDADAGRDPTLNASYGIGSAATAMERWTAGETRRYTATVTNLGSTTWEADGVEAPRLGVSFGGESERPGDGWATDQRIVLPHDVRPGESVAVPLEVTAPDADGAYVLRHRMSRGALWSSDVAQVEVAVTSTIVTWEDQLSARYRADERPIWSAAEQHTLEIELTNTGTYTWNAGGDRLVRLSVSFGHESDSPGDGWSTDERFALDRDVAPGEEATLRVTVTAPEAPGDYAVRYRLVKENTIWFDELRRADVSVLPRTGIAGWPWLGAGAVGAVTLIGVATVLARRHRTGAT